MSPESCKNLGSNRSSTSSIALAYCVFPPNMHFQFIANHYRTVPYCVIIMLAVIYHTSRSIPDGTCIVGIKSQPLIAFIIFDASLNLYLTIIFVIPLRSRSPHPVSPPSLEPCIKHRILPFFLPTKREADKTFTRTQLTSHPRYLHPQPSAQPIPPHRRPPVSPQLPPHSDNNHHQPHSSLGPARRTSLDLPSLLQH
jgi:hypothetical protein